MKFPAVLTLTLAFVAAAFAQSPGQLRIDLDKPDAPKQAPKQDTKKKDDGKKKEEAMGKIEGIEIPHGNGFMGLQLVNGSFKLTFYNAKKKPTKPDVLRAILRWPVHYQFNPERTVLNPDGGSSLSSSLVVRPPLTFRLFITLVTSEDDNAPTESFPLDFHP